MLYLDPMVPPSQDGLVLEKVERQVAAGEADAYQQAFIDLLPCTREIECSEEDCR